MTEPLTTTELLAMADRLEAEAKRLQAKAAEIRSTVATIEAIRATGPLTSEMSYVTDDRMTSSAFATGPSRGPVPDKDGPATKAMMELGYANLAELAKALGERHGTVRSWNLRDDLPERVRPAVEALRKKRAKAKGK